MVPKPPVDIEWYDDGFSMEEQKELQLQSIKEKKAQRPIIKVTAQYHQTKQEQIISELRTKLAADEEYIKELENDLNAVQLFPEGHHFKKKAAELKRINKSLEKQLYQLQSDPTTELGKAYILIHTLQQELKQTTQELITPYQEIIKEREKEIQNLKFIRDHLLTKIYAK